MTDGQAGITSLHVIPWMTVDEIFAPLPPTRWISRELMIGPGRPSMLVGYGASMKTLAAQQLALAVAAGGRIWNHFDARQGVVGHIDFEQGIHATAKRYQRGALGLGMTPSDLRDRLKLSVMPSTRLSDKRARDAYTRAAYGVDLLIIDSLRAGAPNIDENDSKIRECIDLLTMVSEETGAACMIIHHSGKPKEGNGDARLAPRGSSGIFDACGCVYQLVASKTSVSVRQIKLPAEAEGGEPNSFRLVARDVHHEDDPKGGVRVEWQALDEAHSDVDDATRLLDAVNAAPGATQNEIVSIAGMQKSRAVATLARLVSDGRLSCSHTGRSKSYRLVE